MSGQVRIWIDAARPKTLPAAIAPVLIGTALAFRDSGFHIWSALAALLGAVWIQIGTNFANDYFDHVKGTDTGDRLGPVRATSAGLVSKQAMKNATFVAFTIAFVIGIYLVYRGGWPIVIVGLSAILFGVMYTGGPFPLGYNGLGDLFVLIFFGPVAVGGTYYVQTLTLTETALIAGLAPGLFSVAILTVNNLRDIDSDRKTGKKTLQVCYGKTFARVEYLLCIFLACLLPLLLYLKYDSPVRSLPSCLVLLVAIPTIHKLFTNEGRPLNDVLAQTGRLLFIFSLIFSVGWIW